MEIMLVLKGIAEITFVVLSLMLFLGIIGLPVNFVCSTILGYDTKIKPKTLFDGVVGLSVLLIAVSFVIGQLLR